VLCNVCVYTSNLSEAHETLDSLSSSYSLAILIYLYPFWCNSLLKSTVSKVLLTLCNDDVWICKLWFVLFYIYNNDVTHTPYYKLNSFFYINRKEKSLLTHGLNYHSACDFSALQCCHYISTNVVYVFWIWWQISGILSMVLYNKIVLY